MRSIAVIVLSLLIAFPAGLMAQEPQAAPNPSETLAPPETAPVEIPIPNEQVKTHSFIGGVLKDNKDLWLSPRRIQRSDAKWLLPLAGATGFLFATDHNISDAARNNEALRQPSHFVSSFGSWYALGPAVGAFYGVGKLTHNKRATDTGRLSGEALLQTEIVVQGLKFLFNRTRPNGGGQSFPSGHAASSFAFATVVAEQYHDKPLIAIGAYSAATAVSLSRIGGLNHFPSDVLVGATIGTLIGRFVVQHHNDKPSLNHSDSGAQATRSGEERQD